MKLYEIKDISSNNHLVENVISIWEERGQLDEGLWDVLKTGFGKIANTFNEVYKKANTKSGMNDVVLRNIYTEELNKLKPALNELPDKVKNLLIPMLTKVGIKVGGGIDLSRKHLNRIMVIKVIRLVLFAVQQMKDNGVQWILSAMTSGGLMAIINLIMDAKDYKEIGQEFLNSSKQLKLMFDKANENNP